MKFLLISPKNRTVYNFRGDLIRSMQERGYEVTVIGPDRTDIERVMQLGVDFVEIPMHKNGTSVKADLRYYRSLKKVISEQKPDVVLGYTVKPVIYGAMAAKKCKVASINCMITGAGYTLIGKTLKARLLGIIVKTLYRRGLRCADNVIFQNDDDRNDFVSMKLVKPEKCHTVQGSGVNIEHFGQQPLPDGMRFFMLSRLLKSKGVGEYLKAAKTVKDKHPVVEFSLLGKYEYEMQDAIDANEVEAYIKSGVITRHEETADVSPYYADCSVYVLPSYREGTPRTVLEAMATGRAIITTDAPGCRQTVEDGVNGYLVPVGDSEALAQRMTEFIENPSKAEQMGKQSRRIAEERYDVNKVNSDMLKIMGVKA